MMTPGQASRIACWISLLTLTCQDGRWPLFGSCWRKCICMMLAPASNAALASRAICSGVTGTLCCFGSVSTPFSEQVMTALSPMDQPFDSRKLSIAFAIMRPGSTGFLRPCAIVGLGAAAGRKRKIARAGKDRARLQPVEAPDRVAEMRRVGIADILREMREVDVLVREVQQMPRALPGAERTERDSGLFLEQMQEARRRQPRLRGAACRRHRLAAEFSDLHDRTRHPRIERAARQRLAETEGIEFGIGNVVAALTFAQRDIGRTNPVGEICALGSREPLDEILEHAGRNALRLAPEAKHPTVVAGDGVKD